MTDVDVVLKLYERPLEYFNPLRDRDPRHFETPGKVTLRRFLWYMRALALLRARLIDRSHHNAQDDVNALAQGGDIVAYMHKLTQGTSYDPAYIKLGQDRLKKAFDAGLLISGYHMFADGNGRDEADFFLNAFQPVHDYTGGVYLPSMLDIELFVLNITKTLRQARAGNWLFWVNDAQKKLPMWYSSAYLFGQLLGADTPWRNQYRKHIASWTSAASPTLPAGVDESLLFAWQYGVLGKHPWVQGAAGIVGECDMNYLLISLAEAKEIAGSGQIPIDPELTKRVEVLEAQILEIHAMINTLQSVDGALVKTVASLANQLSVINSKVPNLEGRISELERLREEFKKLL